MKKFNNDEFFIKRVLNSGMQILKTYKGKYKSLKLTYKLVEMAENKTTSISSSRKLTNFSNYLIIFFKI